MKDYSLGALISHCNSLKEAGELSKSKANNWKTACRSVISGLSPTEIADIRTVDLDKAISIYKSMKNPSKKTAAEYRGRVGAALSSFLEGTNSPVSPESEKKENLSEASAPTPAPKRIKIAQKPVASASNTLKVPLRPDFLAQLILPYDLKPSEARRLCKLIEALPMEEDS